MVSNVDNAPTNLVMSMLRSTSELITLITIYQFRKKLHELIVKFFFQNKIKKIVKKY